MGTIAARNASVTSAGIAGGDEALGGGTSLANPRHITMFPLSCNVACRRGGVGFGMVGAGGLHARWGWGPADVVQTAGAFP